MSRKFLLISTNTRRFNPIFSINLTCLVPTENPEVGSPARLELRELLWHFLHFRMQVVTHRLENELEGIKRRIHILEGFETVFDALDEI